MQRIVSLLPSSTEIVCALGARDRLVGRSHECDYPAGVDALPSCTAPKFDPDGTSYQIDQRVKAVLQEAAAVYRVDADLLDTLEPDLLVTQSQCEVCAVSLKEVEEAACQLVRSQPAIIALEPNALSDVWADIERVAQSLDLVAEGQLLLADLQQRLTQIERRAQALKHRPKVACIEWFEPLMAAGNWIPELVEIAGGDNLFGQAGQHSPWLDWEDLQRADADIIALMPCGFSLPRVRAELAALTDHPAWQKLPAVQNGQVYLTDGNQYFNRPGPRLVESVEILAELFHPDHFNFGHQGVAWERWEG
ncbi:MAG: ABC transporter substrate-binding protein [Candidatus Latescibacteria bacterium]|nr:ABC transporter substrate-binding protein [Candidatus Latescibacterota bacterium]